MRTLAEAAAEVLNKSRTETPKEGMHKLSNTGSGLDSVVDLGGSTYDNPSGGDLGVKAANARGVATPPGVKPDAKSMAPMEKLEAGDAGDPENDRPNNKEASKVSLQKAGEKKSPEDDDGIPDVHGDSDHEYMHPTKEEYELSEEEIAEAKAERWESAKKKMKSMSCKEDIDAMFSNESLSEEFKSKAATIFEAAVMVAESLEEDILDAAQEALDDAKVEIEEQVDTYLNFVCENWVKENQVAIESGLRSEIVEDFINGLKNLFTEHYVDVPAEKVDLISAQADEIEALQAQVNEALNANAELSKKLSESKKVEILATVSEGLTATQTEKLKTLAEGVEFTTDGEYVQKLKLIRESYFNGGKTVKTGQSSVIQLTESESPAQVEEEKVLSPEMQQYLNALGRTQKV